MKWIVTSIAFAMIGAVSVSAQSSSVRLLVLEKDDRTLAIIDPTTLQVTARVPAGEDPHEVAATPDGKFAYISNYGAFRNPQHTVSVVDLQAQRALPAIDLGGLMAPHGMQFADGKVYFTAEGSKAIGRIDPTAGKVDWALGLGQNRTHMLVVSKDGKRIFTSNVNSDTISILDLDAKADASGWVENPIAVGKGPEGFDVAPDGKEVWAANSHDGSISVIEVASRKVVQSFDLHLKFANRLKFTRDGKQVLVSDLGTGELVVVDVASRKDIKRVKLGRGCAGILLAPDGSRAYVAVSPDSNIAVIDLQSLAVVGRIAVGKGPDGMAWATRR